MGDAELQAFIGRIRKLGTLPADAAKLAAPLVEKAVRATADAGVTPDGKPWPEKKGGGRALPGAGAALSARAVGPSVLVVLKGPYVLHDRGKGHAPQRKVLPDGGAGLPKNVAGALVEASELAFKRAMGVG